MDTSIIKSPVSRRWTMSEYYAMAELGWFEGQHVELIEGEVIVMSPQNWTHSFSFDKTAEVLRDAFGKGYWVRTQVELHLPDGSAPEPDVSVVVGSRNDYQKHPTAAVLVIEVSGTSLEYDRTRKASLYAKGAVPDYWVINLFERQVEIRRGPRKNSKGEWEYSSVQIFKEGSFVSPLEKPKAKIAVTELLPPKK